MGLDLDDIGSPRLTWGRLWRLIHVMPRTSRSAYAWAKTAEGGAWPIDIELLAGSVDALSVANWQRSKKASQASSAPKPIKRPSKTEALRGGARDELEARGRRLLERQRSRPVGV
ncbi:hypothetical protein [Streptomyces lonarensis]|uniref:Uncharacterized protein n=1 Tax=Streptomyces lonarensis TaxID=700599 RepID=A0A7X6CXM5_9ACTN|nr:hypothetical protein [Streptomyces lonarensis]NJQ04294.1 hypothetical protein [Streptomyces lonarensis]